MFTIKCSQNGVRYYDILCNGNFLERCVSKKAAKARLGYWQALYSKKGDALEAKGNLDRNITKG